MLTKIVEYFVRKREKKTNTRLCMVDLKLYPIIEGIESSEPLPITKRIYMWIPENYYQKSKISKGTGPCNGTIIIESLTDE